MPKKFVAIAALAIAGMFASGCPLLMVGSLGYQGYKYHETGKLPGMPDKSSSSSSSSKTTQTNNKKSTSNPPASDVE